jgi:hypothetical protein
MANVRASAQALKKAVLGAATGYRHAHLSLAFAPAEVACCTETLFTFLFHFYLVFIAII